MLFRNTYQSSIIFLIKKDPYNGYVEINYDDNDDSCVITQVADYLPARSVQKDWDKIRIKGRVHLDRNAINSYDLKEITFEDFCHEDRIFSLYCFDLRKVSFNYKGRMNTKYIPPKELTSLTVTRLMSSAFAPCSIPCRKEYRRTIYDRHIIDSIFCH